MIYKLTYDVQLPSMNQIIDSNRKNKFAAAKEKKQYTKLIAYLTKAQMRKSIEKKVDISCHWYVKNRMTDKDNIAGGIKFLLDGLQEAQVIKNDGWKEIGNIFHFFEVDKNNPRIELFLTEVEE